MKNCDSGESLPPAAIIYDEKLASARQLYPSQLAKTDSHLARAAGNPRTDYAKRSNVTITIRWKCSGMLAGSRARRSYSFLPTSPLRPFRGSFRRREKGAGKVISGLAPRGPSRIRGSFWPGFRKLAESVSSAWQVNQSLGISRTPGLRARVPSDLFAAEIPSRSVTWPAARMYLF